MELRLTHRVDIEQLASAQLRIPIQHEAEDQDDLPAVGRLILVMQRRHGLALADPRDLPARDFRATGLLVAAGPEQ
jgi:hypothetical protein